MKLKMLWTGEFNQQGYDEFSEYFDIQLAGMGVKGAQVFDKRLSGNDLVQALAGVDVYLCGYEDVTKEVIKNCPDLKLILSVRDGPEENIDLKACEECGIPVLSSAGRCAVSVAELTFALMLNLARPIIKLNNYIYDGKWTKENANEVRGMYSDDSIELFGKTVGIVGLGRNGYRVAQFCKPFHTKLIAYDPFVDKGKMKAEGIEMVDLDTLMSTSDFVVTLARVTPETKGMISRDKISMMKKSAVLINTGRGALIDNDALLDAIENDQIRGAALDAHITEPLGKDHRALHIDKDKLILTPHMAGKTVERDWHQCQLLLAQYRDYRKGRIQRFPLTPGVMEVEGFALHGGALMGTSYQAE